MKGFFCLLLCALLCLSMVNTAGAEQTGTLTVSLLPSTLTFTLAGSRAIISAMAVPLVMPVRLVGLVTLSSLALSVL